MALNDLVKVTGKLPREAALLALDDCGILVVPSRWEGLPMVCLEALLMGIPVVASPVNGIQEIIVDETTGLLVTGQRPKDWARAIRRLADDPALHRRLGQDGRSRVLGEFQRSQMVERHLALYSELTA